jgi:hypothetical protein
VPEELRSPKTVVVLDSCALFLLFHPESVIQFHPEKKRALREKLMTLVKMGGPTKTLAVVFDFILYETEREEERKYGRRIAGNMLNDLNVFLVKTWIRGLSSAAQAIDLLRLRHRVLKRFRDLHPVDCALIACTVRLFDEGLNVCVATFDRAMTEILSEANIANFFEVCGASRGWRVRTDAGRVGP